ncbi:hypothetical protein [Haloferula sp. A504]|uniref:hypothetical protein n=1 Tax=Haloferula sp. A504 TaxID=3373601 RepID=UPI0031C00C29|nr:hypothetical protein [Verrucomicrobiaceae bacterium E54]
MTRRRKRVVAEEQFYTPAALAGKCVDALLRHCSFDEFDYILEPSAGKGSFLDHLPPDKTLAIDLDPKDPRIGRADFFDWNPPLLHGPILTVGNPPFGARAGLAVRFVERACSFSDCVAFILPRSFRKHTFLNRVPGHFHLQEQFDCDTFERDSGEQRTVKTVFQIWKREAHPRSKIVLATSHEDFEMKHFHLSRTSPEALARARAEYDFALPQVGAKFVPRDVGDINAGSYWFIKAKVSGVRERFEVLDFSFLDGLNTTFMSLSKKDIIAAYITAARSETTPAS